MRQIIVHGHRYDAGPGWFRPASAPQTRRLPGTWAPGPST